MTLFESLAPETIAQIFEYLSPQSALNFALTKRIFYSGGKLAANRSKIVSLTHPDVYEQLQQWLNNQEVLRSLRMLEVTGVTDMFPKTIDGSDTIDDDSDGSDEPPDSLDASSEEETSSIIEPRLTPNNGTPPVTYLDIEDALISLIKTLSNLKVLKWTAGVLPLHVLEALHKYQKSAELHIYGFKRQHPGADDNVLVEKALASSPALTVFSAHLWAAHHYPDLRLACVQRIIASAPNLRFASVVDRHTDSHAFRVNMAYASPAQHMAQRTEVNFLTYGPPNASLRRLTLDGDAIYGDLLQSWGRRVDFSKLEELKISRGKMDAGTFGLMSQTLTSLKRLSINLRQAKKNTMVAAEAYLANCPPLESLSIWSGTEKISLESILPTHGPTLVQLELREPENYPEYQRRTLLTAEQCKAIRESCPKLRDLTIDRYRHTQALDTEIDEDDALKELVGVKLSRLQIYYNLASHVQQVQPLFMRSVEIADSSSKQPSLRDLHYPRASLDRHIEPFLRNLWGIYFASANPTSPRILEVKFGEWEILASRQRPVGPTGGVILGRTRWIVLPHDNSSSNELVIKKEGHSAADPPN